MKTIANIIVVLSLTAVVTAQDQERASKLSDAQLVELLRGLADDAFDRPGDRRARVEGRDLAERPVE